MGNWAKWLKDEEKEQVDAIKAARERLKARDQEYTGRIKTYMNRAIRRMRRAEGKS